MNYEEKYREALQAVNELKQINQSDDGIQKWADKYFPELKDSKDEEARKSLLKFLHGLGEWEYPSTKVYKMWLAWLERQGEYNLIENYPIFRVGDCIRNKKTNDKVLIEQLDIATKTYWHVSYDGAAVNHSDFPFSQQNEWEIIGQDVIEKKPVISDEAIREGIIHFGITQYQIDNWLKKYVDIERQDKRKNFETKQKPEFKVGDYLVNDYCKGKVIALTDDAYLLDTEQYIPFSCEHNAHLWTIQDAEPGDVLAYPDGSITLFNCLFENIYMAHVLWVDGHIELNNSCAIFNVHPATKEQRDLLFQKMKEAGYEWNAEKKELNKIEEKPVEKVEPKFKVGDWVVQGCNLLKIRCVGDKYYCYETVGGYVDDMLVSEIDSLYHLWTIQEAKDGDVLQLGKFTAIFKRLVSNENCICYCSIYCSVYEGKFEIPCQDDNNYGFYDATPATKEQCDLLFQKIKEAGFYWDAEKKELKKIEQSELTEFEDAVKDMMNAYRDAIGENDVTTKEVKKHVAYLLSLIPQKSAWSEEDKNRLNHVIKIIDFNIENGDYYYGYNGRDYLSKKEIVNWLKLLKERYAWKPSEEQMKSLSLATQCVYAEEDIKNLESLYTDLKKI